MMNNRNFGMGFFGRNPFDKEARKQMKEKWSKMTDSEKLECINKRMEHFENPEDRFSVEAIDAHCEKWMAMSNEEKQEFIDEKKKAFECKIQFMQAMHGMHAAHGMHGHAMRGHGMHGMHEHGMHKIHRMPDCFGFEY